MSYGLLTLMSHRIAETLPEEVLAKLYAPPKSTEVKTLHDPTDLEAYDGFLLGIPTRYVCLSPLNTLSERSSH